MKNTGLKLSADARRKRTAQPLQLPIRHILATTDLSPESIAGVRYGVALAQKVGATLTLLHVFESPPPPPMPGMRTVAASLQESRIAKTARARLKTVARQQSQGDVNITSTLRSGNALYGIITTARERAPDLVVIATHGYTGTRRVWLGSTAERVVRHAPCPVMTVPVDSKSNRTGKRSQASLRKILIPIDFSKVSGTALPWGASLAVDPEAEVILLHVVQKFPIDYLLGRQSQKEIVTPLLQEAAAELQRMAERLSERTGLKASATIRYGTPFEEICLAAKQLGVDVITLTTRGNTGLKQLWLGSTAERVVRHARCPVLVVREPKRNVK